MSFAEHKVQEASGVSGHPSLQGSRILVVDDEVLVREVLVRKLVSQGYVCDACPDGLAALDLLAEQSYDLLVTDVNMPGMGGLALLDRAREQWPDMAVVLVTSIQDLELAVDALRKGASDYILKPFSLQHLAIGVASALERRCLEMENRRYERTLEDQVASRTRELKQALEILEGTYHSTLVALGTALDSRDADTDGHSLRVTLYTVRLARQMGLEEGEIRVIEQGALLHDIGKIGVPDAILRKPGKLTESEWEQVRKHPEIGCRILSGIKFLLEASRIVLHHQERFDGTGYPGGLAGDQIDLGARIFAVADTLDCMTSDRPFQKAVSFQEARDEIAAVAGSQLDPSIVARFLEIPLEEWRQIRAEVARRQAHVRRARAAAAPSA